MSALVASLIMTAPHASGKRRADSPHPNVHGMNEREVTAHGNGWTCTETVCCARCHMYMPGVRTNSVLVNVGDKAWKIVWHRKSATFQQFLSCVKDTDTYVGRKSMVSQDANGELLANYSEIYLFPRLLGGAKPKAKNSAAKLAKVVKKVKREVKKVKRMKRTRSNMPAKLVGHGDYAEDIGNIAGKGISKGINWLSGKAKGWLGKLFGSGDYTSHEWVPKSNSLWHKQASPEVVSSGDKPGIVRFREYVRDVYSNQNFQIQTIEINPGLPSAFPWLSLQARGYQRYKIRGMVVEFVTTIGPYGGANVNGTVSLSARYDLTLPQPTNIASCLNSKFAVPGRPVDNIMMAVECAHDMTPVNVHEIRLGALPSGADPFMFDHCYVDIANVGQADSTIQIGQIWISYEVELEFPIATDGLSSTTVSDHFSLGTVTSSSNWGDTSTADKNNSIGCTLTGTQLRFPPWVRDGTFYITSNYYAASASTITAPVITTSRCNAVASFGGASASVVWSPFTGVSSNRFAFDFIIDVTGVGPVVTLTGLTFTGLTTGDLYILPIKADVLSIAFNKTRFKSLWDAELQRELDLDERMQSFLTKNFGLNMPALVGDEKFFLPTGGTPGGPCDEDKQPELSDDESEPGDQVVVDRNSWLEFCHYKSLKHDFAKRGLPIDDHTSLASEKSGFISIKN